VRFVDTNVPLHAISRDLNDGQDCLTGTRPSYPRGSGANRPQVEPLGAAAGRADVARRQRMTGGASAPCGAKTAAALRPLSANAPRS
jgi:hypothetical protein